MKALTVKKWLGFVGNISSNGYDVEADLMSNDTIRLCVRKHQRRAPKLKMFVSLEEYSDILSKGTSINREDYDLCLYALNLVQSYSEEMSFCDA